MRIGITCHESVGGSSRIALCLAHELAARGHRVHVFSRRQPWWPQEHRDGLRFHVARGGTDPNANPGTLVSQWPKEDERRFVSLLRRVSLREDLQVLHYHHAVPLAPLVARARELLGALGPAVVGTLHGTDVSALSPEACAAVTHAVQSADALTTVSEHQAKLAAGVFRLATPPLVVPNFVDTGRHRPGAESAREDRRVRLVHVSNFRAVKRCDDAIRLLGLIREQVDAELWLVGDGPEQLRARAVARALRLEGHVRFLGLRDDVHDVLPQCDLLLVTSQHESFCLSALEAMACGVPVLAPRVGGIPEVVLDGVTGRLYGPGELTEAASSACALLRDEEGRRAAREAAVRRAQRYSASTVVSAYEAVHAAAVRSTGVRRARTTLEMPVASASAASLSAGIE